MLNMDDEYHEHDPIYIHLFILMMNHLYHLYIHLCLWMMKNDPIYFQSLVHPILAPFWHSTIPPSLRNPVLSQILHSQLIAFQCRLERQDCQLPLLATLGQHQTWGRC